jgi:hypothetical protein
MIHQPAGRFPMKSPPSIASRRHLLLGGIAATTTAVTFAKDQEAGAPAMVTSAAAMTATTATIPMMLPRSEFVYEAVCDLEPSLPLGQSPYGERWMVPIIGGSFEGPGLRGKVMPGGGDRQLVRRDGAKTLDAIYELQTHDGAIISIRNRVLTRPLKAPQQGRYAFSTLDIVAPDGPYGWLNEYVYVGTLDSLRPARNAVVIPVFRIV